MQNAADAAVMAGAWKMLDDEESMSDYSHAWLIDFVPAYILEDPDTHEAIISTRDTTNGDIVAKAYVKHNLSPEDYDWDGDTIVDAYDTKNNILTFASKLYGRGQDMDDYGYYAMWYQVILEEDVRHFFMPGWFAPMKAKVQSVAKFTHYIEGPNLFEQTLAIAEEETYKSWDHIKMEKSNAAADERSVLSTGNKYREGDKHRFEVLRLNGNGGTNSIKYGNPYTTTGSKDQTGFDDLFIDWQGDMNAMNTDTDIGINGTKSDPGKKWSNFFTENGTENKLTGDDNLQRRIHGTINFEPLSDGSFPYKVRADKEPPDVLYARIESEPVHDGSGLEPDGNGGYKRKRGDKASSVHQIIINLNVSNTTVSGTDKLGYTEYSDRPVFFYYTGPEKNLSGSAEVVDYYDGYNEASHVRDSLPVIINFNANFRGIFFFPNSPVVINGNGNDFYGYVIAKEFVRLKKYKYDDYEPEAGNGDFLRCPAADEKDDVYYNRSLLVKGTTSVNTHKDFTSVTINGQTKYVLKRDLITDAADLITIGDKTYRKDEAGTAEDLASAMGNGKINYYYTLRKTKNEDWQLGGTGWLDFNKAMTTDINGAPTTDTSKTVLAVFGSNWNYNNDGNDDNDNGKATGKGVWRVKKLLSDGTEPDTWLDETEDYASRFLLKEASKPPKCLYETAEALLTANDCTQIDDTNWKKADAREYIKFTSGGTTYYLPQNVLQFDSGTLVPENMDGIIPVKYYEGGDEKTGCADISGNPEKYYKIYQDNYDGNPTTNNPVFVDELGNVQYRHKKDADGNEIATNEDGSVAYETISPTKDPHTDPALKKRATDEAVKELTAKYKFDTNNQMTAEEREAYINQHYAAEYAAEVSSLFNEKFPYLIDVLFFDERDFNLNSSLFDSFEGAKMTEYSYLNMKGDQRSINNLFTNADAVRTD